MAETYISTSTGTGQGGAQVFSPNVIPIDTTSLQRGMYAVGSAIGAKKDAEAKAAAEKKKADDLEKYKAMQDIQDVDAGKSLKYNQALETVHNDFIDHYLNKQDIPIEIVRDRQNDWSAQVKAIQAAQTQEMQQMEYLKTHPEVKAWDEETGSYKDAYYVRAKELASPLGEDEVSLTTEGQFPAYMMSSYTDFGQGLIPFDDKFSLADETTSRFKEWAAQNGVTQATIESINDEYDLKKIISYLPESSRQQFLQYMKSPEVRKTMEPKWFTNTLVQENLPNRNLNLADPVLQEMTHERYDEAIDSIILPKTIKERVEIVKSPDSNKRDGGAVFGITYEGQSPKYENGKIEQSPSLLFGDVSVKGKTVSGITKQGGKTYALVTTSTTSGGTKTSVTELSDDKELIDGYKNIFKDKAAAGEKQSVLDAITEFDKAQPRIINLSAEQKDLHKEIEGFFEESTVASIFNQDDEAGLIEAIKNRGYEVTSELEDLIDDVEFEKEEDRQKIIDKLFADNVNMLSVEAEQTSASQPAKFKIGPDGLPIFE